MTLYPWVNCLRSLEQMSMMLMIKGVAFKLEPSIKLTGH